MKFAQSKVDGPHALLAAMVGEWAGVARTWFEPGKLADEAPIKGSTRLILDGMFLLHEYEGGMTGHAMQGLAIHGYSCGEKRWQTAWVDSVHNGTRIMLSQGAIDASTGKPNFLGSYPAPPGPDWGWRTTLELRDIDNLVISHFNITPDGDESIGVEIDYRPLKA